MTIRSEITEFVRSVEASSKRALNFPEQVAQLLECAARFGRTEVFEDAAFHAKFVLRAREVMQRVGKDGDGFDKLASEHQASLEKTTTLLRTLVKDAEEGVKQIFVKDFFALESESFSRLNGLLADLSRVKNWQVDGKPLPWAQIPSKTSPPAPMTSAEKELKKVSSTVFLLLALVVAFVLLEPPVSTLGWACVFVMIGLLIYNVLTLNELRRALSQSNKSDI